MVILAEFHYFQDLVDTSECRVLYFGMTLMLSSDCSKEAVVTAMLSAAFPGGEG